MENRSQLAQQQAQQQQDVQQQQQQQTVNNMMAQQQPQMQYSQNMGMQQSYQGPQSLGGGPETSPSQGGQIQGQSPGAYPTALAQQQQAQLSYQHLQQQHQQQLQMFWANQMSEIEQVNDFKNHQLPLARIKKIMKADEDVRMISAEAPVLFAKACEMFILELTLRSWIHTEENKRRTLQKNDIAAAITRTDIFDFLVDIVPRDELNKEDGLGVPRGAMPVGSPVSYEGVYYVQTPQGPVPQAAIGSPAMMGNSMMGVRPAMAMDPTAMYQPQPQSQPQRPPMQYMQQQAPMQQMWQQQPTQMPPNQQAGMPPNS